ncbi:MAG: O-antigen ligase family protein, partial [Ktedonobacteraceae bacterium]|nr:O-antigen ligase family protein [Ktedonobacteraceae bacterium]
VDLGGLHLPDLLTFLLAASWLTGFALQRIRPGSHSGPLDRECWNTPPYLALTMLALLLAMLLSTTTTSGLELSIKELVKWLEVLIILFLGLQYIRTRRQIWLLLTMVLLAGISQSLYGYAQSFFSLGPTSFMRDESLRVYGTFDQPNPYSGYINMSLSIAIALTLFAGDWKTRILAGITTPLLAVAVFLSQSKGGELALAIALALIITLGPPRLRLWIGAASIAVLCLVGAYLGGLIPDTILFPIFKKAGLTQLSFTIPRNYNYANSERLAHWVAGIHMFLDHPLLGVGIGNYATAYPHYALGIFVLPLGHAHNYYINIAAEAGIFGLLTLLFFLGAIFLASARSYRAINRLWAHLKTHRARPHPGTSTREADMTLTQYRLLSNDRALAIGLLGALLAVCAHNLVDNLYVHSMTNLFALLIVMLLALKNTRNTQIHASVEPSNSGAVKHSTTRN